MMDIAEELRCFDETLIHCGLNHGEKLSRDELIEYVFKCTRVRFPSCEDIFSDKGVTREQVIHSVCCMSLVLCHNTEMRNFNGKSMCFVCWSSDKHQARRSKRMEKSCPAPTIGIKCPFYLHFKRRKNGAWFFQREDPLNCVSTYCHFQTYAETKTF